MERIAVEGCVSVSVESSDSLGCGCGLVRLLLEEILVTTRAGVRVGVVYFTLSCGMGPKNGSSSDSCPEDSDKNCCVKGWELTMLVGFLAFVLGFFGLDVDGAGGSESLRVRLWR